MRHTIVIELPEGADPAEVEASLTRHINERTYATGQGLGWPGVGYGTLTVVEYHHEQMTTTEED